MVNLLSAGIFLQFKPKALTTANAPTRLLWHGNFHRLSPCKKRLYFAEIQICQHHCFCNVFFCLDWQHLPQTCFWDHFLRLVGVEGGGYLGPPMTQGLSVMRTLDPLSEGPRVTSSKSASCDHTFTFNLWKNYHRNEVKSLRLKI